MSPRAKELLNRVLAGSRVPASRKGPRPHRKKGPTIRRNLCNAGESLHRSSANWQLRHFTTRTEVHARPRILRSVSPTERIRFPGQHAYSHAIALSSAGKAYLVEGDAKYKRAMQNAFTLLTTQQQFASGGWGPNETFIEPHKGQLYDSLCHNCRPLRNPLRRLRCHQACPLSAALHRRSTLRRQPRARRLQHHSRRQAARLRRRLSVLLHLQSQRHQSLLPEKVAVLLRHSWCKLSRTTC